MKNKKKQGGMIPLLVVVALVAMLIGGYVGFKLGDGHWFGFGVGAGIVLVAVRLLAPYADQVRKALGLEADK